MIARLAAANPVPAALPARRRRPRWPIAAVAVAALIPAVYAVADQIDISNTGTPVPLESVPLGPALESLQVGGTMQYLGTLHGVTFDATRNADGRYCLAITRGAEHAVGCDIRTDGFPSERIRAFEFPVADYLQGIATDGVATVQALDAGGAVIDSTPVVDNLFASDVHLGGDVTEIRTLDTNGDVLTTQQLRG